MREHDILYENGNYWVKAATFGTGKLKPKSKGFQVLKAGITHSVVIANIGYAGQIGLDKAKAEADRRQDADTSTQNPQPLNEWDFEDLADEGARLGSQQARALGHERRETRKAAAKEPKRYHVTWYSASKGKRTGFIQPIEADSQAQAKAQAKVMVTNDKASNFMAKEVKRNPKQGSPKAKRDEADRLLRLVERRRVTQLKDRDVSSYRSEDAALVEAAIKLQQDANQQEARKKRKRNPHQSFTRLSHRRTKAEVTVQKKASAEYARGRKLEGAGKTDAAIKAYQHATALLKRAGVSGKYSEGPVGKLPNPRDTPLDLLPQRPLPHDRAAAEAARKRAIQIRGVGGRARRARGARNPIKRLSAPSDCAVCGSDLDSKGYCLEQKGWCSGATDKLAARYGNYTKAQLKEMYQGEKRRRRNPSRGGEGAGASSSDVRSPTRTSTEVRSPTKTSTWAKTEGNITVTGGAGAGANTTVVIKRKPNPSVYDRPDLKGERLQFWKRAIWRAHYHGATDRQAKIFANRLLKIAGHADDQSIKGAWDRWSKGSVEGWQGKKINPSTREMSERFNGHANGKVTELKASSRAPGDLSRAGKLVFLKLAGARAQTKIPGAVVCIDPKTERLWIVGNRTPLLNRKANPGEALDFGEIEKICYETAKSHIGGGRVTEYVHTFGEDGGRKPHLHVDAEGMPVIVGGDYKIKAEGIVN